MKKIVIAIDSFKGSISSAEAGQAAKDGVLSVLPKCEVIQFPIADGGDGVLDVLITAMQGRYIAVKAHNPLMELIDTRYGISGNGKTALIEMAAVSGLTLIPQDKRNPMLTTTFGTGELIKYALDEGIRDFIIGIGGSATNDAGLGMLQALGYRFYDKNNNVLGTGGNIMIDVESIDISDAHPALKKSCFTVVCDVNNPFYGTDGAAYVFAGQKGADDEMIAELDKGMRHIAKVIQCKTGKSIGNVAGAGAAGGLGGGLVAFFNDDLQNGIKLLLDKLDFKEKIRNADLIITGEGKADRQTTMGKVPFGILQEAKKQNIPVILIAGSIEDVEELNDVGFKGIFSVTPYPIDLEQAMQADFTKQNITRLLTQICSVIKHNI